MINLNELIKKSIKQVTTTYIPRCEECLHWKIEWDEYYDNSYCLLKNRGMSCNREASPRILEGRVRESVEEGFNEFINKAVKEYIKENVRDDYRKYLPFRYEGNIK